jgi:hypothetical protein
MEDITVEKAAVGIVGLIALNLVLKAVTNIFKTFLRPGKDLKKLGKWAVVTGATGKNFWTRSWTHRLVTSAHVFLFVHSQMVSEKLMHLLWPRRG